MSLVIVATCDICGGSFTTTGRGRQAEIPSWWDYSFLTLESAWLDRCGDCIAAEGMATTEAIRACREARRALKKGTGV